MMTEREINDLHKSEELYFTEQEQNYWFLVKELENRLKKSTLTRIEKKALREYLESLSDKIEPDTSIENILEWYQDEIHEKINNIL